MDNKMYSEEELKNFIMHSSSSAICGFEKGLKTGRGIGIFQGVLIVAGIWTIYDTVKNLVNEYKKRKSLVE